MVNMASIKQRPNGSWRARYRDEDGKEHARHFPRKIDAQHWLKEVDTAVLTGQYVDPRAGKVTLSQHFDEWEQRQIWAPSTRRGAKNALKHCTFKNRQIKTIRKADLETHVKRLHDEGFAASSIRLNMRFLQMMFRAAVEDRVIPNDPTVGVKLPRADTREEIEIPDPVEVGALINAAEHPMKLLVAICAFAGLRRGEAISVQYGDFDLKAQTLSVARQVRPAEGGGSEFEEPKHGSSRVVYVPQQLLDLLTAHVDELGVRGKDKWLFSTSPHGPSVSYLDPHWRALRKKVGHDDLRMHDLRHFYASGLIAAGCDVVTVQRAMGHSNASITLSTYSHLWKTAEDVTRGAAEAMMSDARIALL